MCALLSGQPPSGVDCASEGLVAMNRARLDGTLLTVCGRAGATCRDGICGPGCGADDDCVDSNRPRCDVGSGRCVCSAGSCADNASVCGDDGRCRCAVDADCTQGPVDRCVDGQCGCSSLQVCPNATTNPGTSWVCEPPPT